jgi:primosomal protein N''
MLQEDFILRLVREFIEALALFISRMKGKDDLEIHVEFDKFYNRFFEQKSDYFKSMSAEEMIQDVIDRYPESNRLPRIEMLADLLYSEGSLISKALESQKKDLWEKSLHLYEYLQDNDLTYSLPRLKKLDEIAQFLG